MATIIGDGRGNPTGGNRGINNGCNPLHARGRCVASQRCSPDARYRVGVKESRSLLYTVH